MPVPALEQLQTAREVVVFLVVEVVDVFEVAVEGVEET